MVITPMNLPYYLYVNFFVKWEKNLNNKGMTNYPNRYPQGNIVQELKMFIKFTVT